MLCGSFLGVRVVSSTPSVPLGPAQFGDPSEDAVASSCRGDLVPKCAVNPCQDPRKRCVSFPIISSNPSRHFSCC